MNSSCRLICSAILVVTLYLLLPLDVFSQIPTDCSDAESLENSVCCPTTADGTCGMNANRGACVTLNFAGYSNETSDVRTNWPHYYTQVCECNGNYAGHDCGRCKFGYYGSDCSQKQVLPRRPIRELTDEEWSVYNDIIRRTRTYNSGYKVVLEESTPGNASLVMTNVSLYHLYIWIHHYTAKDSMDPVRPVDYSHTGPAFYTWHRLMNLWFEWEIQGMLQGMGQQDYHTFRLPYWDWRIEIQTTFGVSSEELFSENRLGMTRNVSGFPHVFGTLYEGTWETICWLQLGQICDPRVSTGPLQRCPFTGTDPCSSSNPDWPTLQNVDDAMRFDEYDAPPYTITSPDGFRSFVDFKIGDDLDECRNNRMCQCLPGGPNCVEINGIPPGPTFTGQMHFTGHIVPGQGDVSNNLPPNMRGAIEDVAASPNDPLFIIHHTMIDCMLDEWLRRHPDAEYPIDPLVRDGHRRDDYIRSFFPLYTNGDIFKRTKEFGYSCSLSNITDPPTETPTVVLGFLDLETSVQEGDSLLSFCITVVSGEVDTPTTVRFGIVPGGGTATVEDVSLLDRPFLLAPWSSTYCSRSGLLIHDDNVTEDIETLQLQILPSAGTTVDPARQFLTVYIADNDIAQLGFTRPSYTVAEGEEINVCVRVRGRLGRPLVPTIFLSDETTCDGADYSTDPSLPQIVHFPAYSSAPPGGDAPDPNLWCTHIQTVNDSITEGPESLTLSILSTQVGVLVTQQSTVVAISDDEELPSTDASTTEIPTAVVAPLEVYLAGNTPRIEGNRVIIQVQANKPAFAECRLGRGTPFRDCPPGLETTFDGVSPGSKNLRVVSFNGRERASFSLVLIIPDSNSFCTVHLINTGVTVSGRDTRVEFTGVGPNRGFLCSLDREPPSPCSSPHVMEDQAVGSHRLRVTPAGCRDFQAQTFHFTIPTV